MTGRLLKTQKTGSVRWYFQVLLVAAIVLAAFYPTLFGGVFPVDDEETIKAFKKNTSWSLLDVFIPHMDEGIYYRPIIPLNFLLDKFVFNLDPGFMHLESMLLHVINALLVYWLTLQLIQGRGQKHSLLPLIASLAFGLHPITTESVSWISGRTDVLAGTFILLSANCILRFRAVQSFWYLFLSALCMVLGFLTKEVALAFLPGAFLLMSWDLPSAESQKEKKVSAATVFHTYQNAFFAVIGFGAALSFFLLRHFAVVKNEGRISATIRFIEMDIIHAGLIVLRTLGYYVSKLYYPFPLNFTIRDVDPLYEFLAVPLIVIIFIIISRKNMLSALFMSGIILITPAFVIAFGQIAWTLYAERYLYIASSFIIIATVLYISNLAQNLPPAVMKKGSFVVVGLLVIMAFSTFYRSIIWMNSVDLLRDSVDKNPQFYFVRGEYARALALQGDIAHARIQFNLANEYNRSKKPLRDTQALFQLRYWDVPDMGLAYLLIQEKKNQEAIVAYEKIVASNCQQSVLAMNNLLYLYGGQLAKSRNSLETLRLKNRLSFYSKKLYDTSQEAYVYYWLGKVFLERRDNQEALNYFRMASLKFDNDDVYRSFSAKFIARLENP